MTLNLLKLCVGAGDVAELTAWTLRRQKAGQIAEHVTRMFPKRAPELLDGGALYWVIRGSVACRQLIVGLQEVRGSDGIARCRIVLQPKIILVRPTPKRAFQGWRYLEQSDAPPDLERGGGAEDMPEALRRELAALGLL